MEISEKYMDSRWNTRKRKYTDVKHHKSHNQHTLKKTKRKKEENIHKNSILQPLTSRQTVPCGKQRSTYTFRSPEFIERAFVPIGVSVEPIYRCFRDLDRTSVYLCSRTCTHKHADSMRRHRRQTKHADYRVFTTARSWVFNIVCDWFRSAFWRCAEKFLHKMWFEESFKKRISFRQLSR